MLFSLTWLGYVLIVKVPLKWHNNYMKKYRKAESEGKFDGQKHTR